MGSLRADGLKQMLREGETPHLEAAAFSDLFLEYMRRWLLINPALPSPTVHRSFELVIKIPLTLGILTFFMQVLIYEPLLPSLFVFF